jgi:hypothetical protein
MGEAYRGSDSAGRATALDVLYLGLQAEPLVPKANYDSPNLEVEHLAPRSRRADARVKRYIALRNETQLLACDPAQSQSGGRAQFNT